MARRGFFSRIMHAIGSLFEHAGEESPAAPSVSGDREKRDSFREVWNSEVGRSGPFAPSYRQHREIFFNLPGVVMEEDTELLELWRTYLDTMVARDGNRREFENTFGVNLKRDFDWDAWRQAMKYKGGRAA